MLPISCLEAIAHFRMYHKQLTMLSSVQVQKHVCINQVLGSAYKRLPVWCILCSIIVLKQFNLLFSTCDHGRNITSMLW